MRVDPEWAGRAPVALVTGGARGIGRGVAIGLAEAGFDVAIGYLENHAAAHATAERVREAGRRAVGIAADLRDPEACRVLVHRTVAELGRLDLLVSNAGALVTKPFLETTPEEYDIQLDSNARATFFVAQAAAQRMIDQGGGGRIVFVTSEAAVKSYPGLAGYCMSKAAQRMLIEVAAKELSAHGITVNAVAPGTTETDLNREALADPERRKMLLGSILLGRPGSPEDIAAAVRFLASDGAGFLTGSTIAVDGGASIS